MRIFKIIVKIALALAFFVAFNAALTFALEPYGSRSELVWSDYAKQDDLDTILVGTSHTQFGIDPAVLNEECDYDAFNLGTPSQTIEESFVSIRTAYEQHHIKRVILGISTSALTSSSPPNPGSAYMRNRNKHVTPFEALATINDFMWHYGSATTAYSLNTPFPWASNPLRNLTPGRILSNMKAKLEGADVVEVAKERESSWHYMGLGYGTRGRSIDMDSGAVRNVNEGADIDDDQEAGAAVTENTASVNPDRANTIREIVDYCNQHDIELIAIVPPLPVFNVFDSNSLYFETMDNITALFNELGVNVYDFNLADPDLFKSKSAYFSDSFHLNIKGAKEFSYSLARFLNDLESGEDTSALFNTPEEQALTIDYLSALFVDTETDEQGIHLNWRIVTSPENDVEYRVLVDYTDGKSDYKPVSEWSRDTSFTYMPEQQGDLKLRVCARKVGSSEESERHRNVRALW